jgi:4-hydroxyphenylacetate decarboxylase large subunit
MESQGRGKGIDESVELERRALKEIDRAEPMRKPTPRANYLREMYFDSKSSVSMEFPYWYTRKWNELEGELTIIRKAEALKAAFSHLTPTIYPRERLVAGRTVYLRGSFPMPWVFRAYHLANEQDYKNARMAGKVADDAVKVAEGGGNVTRASENVISVSGKFGLRVEEFPIFERTALAWAGKSVEDIALTHEKDVP